MDSSMRQAFEVPELADHILQFLPISSILTLRLVCSAFHDVCTQRRWFYKDMIKFADTEYLTMANPMTFAMAPWVRSVGFFRYKKPLALSSTIPARSSPEDSSTWLNYVIAWNQLATMEISIPWHDWTEQAENHVLELLSTKAMMALVSRDLSNFPQVAQSEADTQEQGGKIRIWECQGALGLRELVLHSSHSTEDKSVGSLLHKLSRGVYNPSSSSPSSSSPTLLCALFEDLVSFRLGGQRATNRVRVPWSSLVQFLTTGAPALRDLSLDTHYLILSALDEILQPIGPRLPPRGVRIRRQRFNHWDTNTDTSEEWREEELEELWEEEIWEEEKEREDSAPPTFPGIRSFTLLSDISTEMARTLGQAFPNLNSLTVSSLDPFWEVPALDPSAPGVYGILPLSDSKSLNMGQSVMVYFPRLERLSVRQLNEDLRPDNLEPLTRRVVPPLLRELVLENFVGPGTRALQSLETSASMHLVRLGLIFKKCSEVSLGYVYRLDVCVDFLSRPCCQELLHLSLSRGMKILDLKMGTIPGIPGAIRYPNTSQWMTMQETIRARVPFVNHLRTLDLRGYPLLFPESQDLIQKLNLFLHACPHLTDLGLLDIHHEDVSKVFHGLGYCPEDYETMGGYQGHDDGLQRNHNYNPMERPRLYRLVLDVLYASETSLDELVIVERIKWDLKARFRFLEDLQVKGIQSLTVGWL